MPTFHPAFVAWCNVAKPTNWFNPVVGYHTRCSSNFQH